MLYVVRREDPFPDDFETRDIKGGTSNILQRFKRWGEDAYCPHCFSRYYPGTQVCPLCTERFKGNARYIGSSEKVRLAGTVLNARFKLGDVLDVTDESVLYAAWDQKRSRQVFIREFFIRDSMLRQENRRIVPLPGTCVNAFSRATNIFQRIHKNTFFYNNTYFALEDIPADPGSKTETVDLRRQCFAAVCGNIGSRTRQEDAADVITGRDFAYGVLCDGMGGMGNGGMASSLCLRELIRIYQALCFSPVISLLPQLKETIQRVDMQIAQLRDESGRRLGCGTTLVCAILRQGALYYASVGDSRLYLIRNSSIRQLNHEHTLRQMLRDQERIETSGAEPDTACSNGDALTSYIGVGGLSQLDITDVPLPLEDDDTVLLCSDGLYRTLTDAEIHGILCQAAPPKAAAQNLISSALKKELPHQDNLTAIVIRYAPKAGKEGSV